MRHYLLAVISARSKDEALVMAGMGAMPVNDAHAPGGRLRVDGRLMRPGYLARLKSPAESHYAWDFYQVLTMLDADQAFESWAESSCPLR